MVRMDRSGIFAGDDPFNLAQQWLREAETAEPNDPNAIALSTVDADGMPNARMVLLKDIEQDAFVFYTNYGSVKAQELDAAGRRHSCCTGSPCAVRSAFAVWLCARRALRPMPIMPAAA